MYTHTHTLTDARTNARLRTHHYVGPILHIHRGMLTRAQTCTLTHSNHLRTRTHTSTHDYNHEHMHEHTYEQTDTERRRETY